ncbi:hypothetical protein [Mesorhizobium sp. CAU 1741]|uniref:hypothetical protein n=1 Tax=Mesorhizobium sp. CAU 1741 TaxID=3140366 RepID=UPI00325BD31C
MATQSNSKQTFNQRLGGYQPSKTMLAWAAAGAAILTMIVGFSWGGWVTGGTSRDLATEAAQVAHMELARDICVERFNAAPGAAASLAELRAITSNSAKRQFVEAGGWATMPGQTSPDRRGADACATALAA